MNLTYRYQTNGLPLCPFCGSAEIWPVIRSNPQRQRRIVHACVACKWEGAIPPGPAVDVDALRELAADAPATKENAPGFWRRFGRKAADLGLGLAGVYLGGKVGKR